MANVHHHQHARRVYKNLEQYPHNDRVKYVFDRLVYIAGIATPIMTFPQLIRIYVEKRTAGVSIVTWSSYLTISLIFTVYGFLHKEKPIIIMYLSQLILQIFIVAGILIYT